MAGIHNLASEFPKLLFHLILTKDKAPETKQPNHCQTTKEINKATKLSQVEEIVLQEA